MHAVNAIYDGNNFTPTQPIPVKEKYKVIITFVEPLLNETIVRTSSGKRPRSSVKGLLKGKVKMSADFDEPLAEMKEYME